MRHARPAMGHEPSQVGNATPLNFAWFGKMPSVGDFISRRMPFLLQQFWDHWCASGLESLKQASGATGWDIWRGSPMWAFLLPAQAGISHSQLGVFAPSCDRVGRIFPFLVILPLPHDMAGSILPRAAGLGLSWAQVIAQAQISRQSINELDSALAAALAEVLNTPLTVEDGETTLPHDMSPLTLPWPDLASTFDTQGGEGFWWSVPPVTTRFRAKAHRGAPNNALFLGLCQG